MQYGAGGRGESKSPWASTGEGGWAALSTTISGAGGTARTRVVVPQGERGTGGKGMRHTVSSLS